MILLYFNIFQFDSGLCTRNLCAGRARLLGQSNDYIPVLRSDWFDFKFLELFLCLRMSIRTTHILFLSALILWFYFVSTISLKSNLFTTHLFSSNFIIEIRLAGDFSLSSTLRNSKLELHFALILPHLLSIFIIWLSLIVNSLSIFPKLLSSKCHWKREQCTRSLAIRNYSPILNFSGGGFELSKFKTSECPMLM